MRFRATGALFGTLALGLLAGCSNDQSSADTRNLVRDTLRGLTRAASGAGAGTTPLAAPVAVLAATDAPVALMQTARGDRLYALGLRDNGPYRTFATATGQTLTLRDGMITTTRGLGQDVMASDTGRVMALLSTAREGRAERRLEVLDGEDRTRIIMLDCVITQGAAGLTALAAPLPEGRQMTETCTGGNADAAGVRFRNIYLVDRAGRIILSRQWLPSTTGPVTMQILRP